MKMSVNSPQSTLALRRGFSLVEVVLALGICSFAMVAIVGMIPVGLSTFKDAMDTTAQSQIVQTLASEVLLTDYRTLTASSTSSPRYYNEQGIPTEERDAIYTATIEQQPLEIPASLSLSTQNLRNDPALTVVIRITKKTNPNQVYSYPVVVANNTGL